MSGRVQLLLGWQLQKKALHPRAKTQLPVSRRIRERPQWHDQSLLPRKQPRRRERVLRCHQRQEMVLFELQLFLFRQRLALKMIVRRLVEVRLGLLNILIQCRPGCHFERHC